MVKSYSFIYLFELVFLNQILINITCSLFYIYYLSLVISVTQNSKFAINVCGHLVGLVLWDCARLYFGFCGTINIGVCVMADLRCVLICLHNNDTSRFLLIWVLSSYLQRVICCAWLLRQLTLQKQETLLRNDKSRDAIVLCPLWPNGTTHPPIHEQHLASCVVHKWLMVFQVWVQLITMYV